MEETQTLEKEIWSLLEEVSDPEIPVLSVVDLGVVRKVDIDSEKAVITITPTYSGCPALDFMAADIKKKLRDNIDFPTEVITKLSPAWTTDWMSETGKKKLLDYGIAPPQEGSSDKNALFGKATPVPCPRCRSTNTKLVSQFGSTACKANYQCNDCKEPFEYFKCHK